MPTFKQQLGLLEYSLKDCNCSIDQAIDLYKEGLLSFNPASKRKLSNLESDELIFLTTLYFHAGIPLSFVKKLLKKLERPYVYSLDEIYWDFASKQWRDLSEDIDKYIENNIQEIIEDNFSSYLDEKSQVEDIAGLESMKEDIMLKIEEIKNI